MGRQPVYTQKIVIVMTTQYQSAVTTENEELLSNTVARIVVFESLVHDLKS